MTAIRILDVKDADAFERIPPCADPGFDHRTCDYWEDEQRGSKAARLSWLAGVPPPPAPAPRSDNPFAPPGAGPRFNPFDSRAGGGAAANPFGLADAEEPLDNPFAPRRARGPAFAEAPRKLQLLARGLTVFGTYAKVLEVDGEAAAYCQFGPLSAYPRAQRVRDLYRQLPATPLPAVITCIATTAAARGQGLAKDLIAEVVADLGGRGFAAVEAYPEPGARPNTTSAATPAFWVECGFRIAVDDERFPVVRREL
ncbi:MAG TPA: GNAT family N-acetyltransferase [Candidatus Limnocylindrales bacterium]|nr:GNAT family N-acetyltransferase [Candidatus Limnocylindrales bacterium]